jgi:uncharacterized protein (TIGR03435 family)
VKLLLVLAATAAYGQSVNFDVVSIKPAPPPVVGQGMRVGVTGGPGTKDPGRWTCDNLNLSNLVSMAFELRAFQLNSPDWTNNARFNINAKLPEGATKEQFRQMMQNMLIERFALKFHREQKEMQGYELLVGKNGPKFKESEPEKPKDPNAEAPPAPGFVGRPALGKDGFPEMPPGVPGTIMMNNRARQQWVRVDMQSLAASLSYQAGKPVNDATGLKGKYDVALFWATSNGPPPPPPPSGGGSVDIITPASDVSGPTLFTALQEQLGLRLEAKKVTIEILVVDHVEKLPTEN